MEKSKIRIIKKCKLVKKKLKNIYENKSNKKNDKNTNRFKKNDIKFKINGENKRICFDKDNKYANDFYYEEELEEGYMVRGGTQSTNNISKIINSKIPSHFMNVLKHKTKLKITVNHEMRVSQSKKNFI